MPYDIIFTGPEWDKYYQLCNDYARNELESTFAQRNRRNQFNKDAMIHQVTTGKLGEWAVKMYLNNKPCKCTEPDMKIYDKYHKSFDADLTVDGVELHVKSQSSESARRFGTSWMFQFNGRGKGHRDPLITFATGLVAFVVVDFEQKMATLHGICEFDSIRDKLREPVKPALRDTKRCIYLEDLYEEDFIDLDALEKSFEVPTEDNLVDYSGLKRKRSDSLDTHTGSSNGSTPIPELEYVGTPSPVGPMPELKL